MEKKKVGIIALIAVLLLVVGVGFNSIFSNIKNNEKIEENEAIVVSETEINKDTDTEGKKDDSKEDTEKENKEDDSEKESNDTVKENKEESKNDDSEKENNNTESLNKDESINQEKPQTSPSTEPPQINPSIQIPKKETVTVSISCQTAINNNLNKEPGFTHLPASGTILSSRTVEIEEGDTVFDVLVREVRKAGIHMEYTGSGSSAYIEGINNLYEFDGGSGSGWMYSVNGIYPNYGCGSYKVKNNDVIRWNYTCDLGKDLGAKR